MGMHVMADLETFGNGSTAAIISIGAVKFDQTGIIDRFHVGVNLASTEQAGLKLDASTVEWWLNLTADNPAAWMAHRALEKADLWNALDGFAQWWLGLPEELPNDPQPIDNMCLWGNGATFDNVILRNAFKACGLEFPAPFWADRCYRTLKACAPSVKLERKGTHHSAVDDAESQALHLIDICAHLGIEL